MNRKEMREELQSLIPFMETQDPWNPEDPPVKATYLGSYMSLDPCGRYHHSLSPNGIRKSCEIYWERLDLAAAELGGWIECGEGDPTDIFFMMPEE